MRNWVKTLFFVSTFSPALLSIAVARSLSAGFTVYDAYYASAGILGIMLNFFTIREIKRSTESFNFTAKKVESNDALMVGVIVTYFLPFFSEASALKFQTVALYFSALALAYWFVDAILPHPILRLLRYRFYKVEAGNGMVYTLITQREVTDPKQVISVKKISGSMIVEVS